MGQGHVIFLMPKFKGHVNFIKAMWGQGHVNINLTIKLNGQKAVSDLRLSVKVLIQQKDEKIKWMSNACQKIKTKV